MDLWSRWLDQPVESSPQDVDPAASPLVGVAQRSHPDRSTALAAVCSDDGDNCEDQRLSEDLGREEEPERNDRTENPASTGFTAADISTSSAGQPSRAPEDSSPVAHSSRRTTLMGSSQDDNATGPKETPPEEVDNSQQIESVCLHPTLPNPQDTPDTLDARSNQSSDSIAFGFRPTSMSRPNRPSPLSPSPRSSQYTRSGSRSNFSPMATHSNRKCRQYAIRPTSCLSLSPTLSQHTGHTDDSTPWRVWEDRPEAGASQVSSANLRKMTKEEATSELLYPCPFRRRNPARFNVRDHTHCAKTLFGSTQELRLHITSYHRRQRVLHQCRRCKLGFESETALDHHMMLPKDQICDSMSEESLIDPEDGIVDAVDRQLVVGHPSVETWEEIWRAVFPGDEDIPAPDFHPIVELVEVEQQFNEGQEALKASLQETLRLFLPPDVDSDFCRFLSGQLELTFETHRANTMRNCLNRFSSLGTDTHFRPPPSAHSADHAVLARRQKRNSKRISLLYSASVPNTPRFPNHPTEDIEHTPSLPLQSLNNVTATPLQRSNSIRSSNRTSRLFLPLPPSHAVRAATPPTSTLSTTAGDNQSDYDCSRESRDSGIGIPCEVCEMDSCQCRQTIRSLSENNYSGLTAQMVLEPETKLQLGTTPDGMALGPVQGHRKGEKKTLRHCQPGLWIKTDVTAGNNKANIAPVSGSTAESSNSSSTSNSKKSASPFLLNIESQEQQRPFSPQSFKQRVMRKVSGET